MSNVQTFEFNGINRVDWQNSGVQYAPGNDLTGAGSNNNNTIDVEIDGSAEDSEIANLYKAYAGNQDDGSSYNGPRCIAKTRTVNDGNPEKLRFYIEGVLSLVIGNTTYWQTDISFAQGKTGSSHNWWLGCDKMTGITWSKDMDQPTAAKTASDTLKLAFDIASGDDVKFAEDALDDAAKAILKAVKPHDVGSGLIGFNINGDEKNIQLILFQMDTHSTTVTLTGSPFQIPNE